MDKITRSVGETNRSIMDVLIKLRVTEEIYVEIQWGMCPLRSIPRGCPRRYLVAAMSTSPTAQANEQTNKATSLSFILSHFPLYILICINLGGRQVNCILVY